MSGPHQPYPVDQPPPGPPQGSDQSWPAPPPGDAWPTPAPADTWPASAPTDAAVPPPPPPKGGSNAGLIIAVVAVAAVALLAACGVGGWFVYDKYAKDGSSSGGGDTTSQAIPGVKDYRADDPDALSQQHKPGDLTYPMTPPAGGPHHDTWQNCTGDVYTTPIPDEQAVHSLEHGAVWITYAPDTASSDVAKLAGKVKGQDYLMLSPHPDQEKPISLQAWGYQLQLDKADDERIDTFIAKYRKEASMEPGAPCSGGSRDSAPSR